MKKQIQKRTPAEKEKLLLDIQKIGVTAGCRQFNVSRSQFYEWLDKYNFMD